MGRKVLAVFVVLLLLACSAAAYFLLTLDGRAKRLIEQSASEYLGVPVTVDDVEISLLRGSAVIRGINVPNPSGFSTPKAFQIRYASASFDLWSALDKVIDIPEIQAGGLAVTIEGSVKGSNISRMAENAKRVANEKEQRRRSIGSPPLPEKLFRVGRVILTDTAINLSATFMGGREASYRIPRIEVTDLPAEASPGDILSRVVGAALRESAKAPGTIGRLLGELTANAGIGVVGSTLESAGNVGKGALEGAGGIAKGVGAGFGEASRSVGTGIGAGIVGVADGVGQVGRGLVGGLGGTVEGVGRGIGEALRRIGAGIGAVGGGALEGTAEVVKGIGRGAVNAVRIVGEICKDGPEEGKPEPPKTAPGEDGPAEKAGGKAAGD